MVPLQAQPTRASLCVTLPKLTPVRLLVHPTRASSKHSALFLWSLGFYLPKLGLQLSRLVYEVFPNWIAPLQQKKASSK